MCPSGDWHGVTTGVDGYVTELSLPGNNLTGEIPAALGDLGNLTRLELSGNGLTGEIPEMLGYLVFLEELWLRENQFERRDTGGPGRPRIPDTAVP